ncbi:MAG: FAD-dependent oxidoreductase [Bilophila wadsworthia]
MNKHENAEIVVIGGGAVGTAVACYLARDGADVALVERGEYAWGSSRRCDGHAVTYDSAPGYFSQFCKIGRTCSRNQPRAACDIEFEPEGPACWSTTSGTWKPCSPTMRARRTKAWT